MSRLLSSFSMVGYLTYRILLAHYYTGALISQTRFLKRTVIRQKDTLDQAKANLDEANHQKQFVSLPLFSSRVSLVTENLLVFEKRMHNFVEHWRRTVDLSKDLQSESSASHRGKVEAL